MERAVVRLADAVERTKRSDGRIDVGVLYGAISRVLFRGGVARVDAETMRKRIETATCGSEREPAARRWREQRPAAAPSAEKLKVDSRPDAIGRACVTVCEKKERERKKRIDER